jgi:hypothetical protein
MSDEQEAGAETGPGSEPQADLEPARDEAGRFADAEAARLAATRRWRLHRAPPLRDTSVASLLVIGRAARRLVVKLSADESTNPAHLATAVGAASRVWAELAAIALKERELRLKEQEQEQARENMEQSAALVREARRMKRRA